MTGNEQEMAQITTEFHKVLYTLEGIENMEAILDTVPVRVTSEMTAKLLEMDTEAEVKEACFQMFSTKAPGPDGYPAHFFQTLGFVWGRGDHCCDAHVAR
jgi:hypothetical protein